MRTLILHKRGHPHLLALYLSEKTLVTRHHYQHISDAAAIVTTSACMRPSGFYTSPRRYLLQNEHWHMNSLCRGPLQIHYLLPTKPCHNCCLFDEEQHSVERGAKVNVLAAVKEQFTKKSCIQESFHQI